LFLALILLVTAACSRAESPESAASTPPSGTSAPAERKYLLERVDDAAVVQLYADQFAALPLREKTLAYHLVQAALAGRDIFYDQKHRNALEMRGVLEAIITHPKGIETQTLSEIESYAKLFWINTGPYNNLTARKFVLKITPQALGTAAQIAEKSGAKFPTQAGESIDALLKRLEPMFFDPNVDPIVTNKNPGPGKDILTSSANNLYSGVSMADLKGFTEKNGLNSRLVKTNGRLVEEVYKIGGRYGKQIAEIVKHLDAAIPFASEPTGTALKALIQWYRTGDDGDRAKYDIAWVKDKDAPVDTMNGFIEVYMDPRGLKGSWEGVVFHVNRQKTERSRGCRQRAVVRGPHAVRREYQTQRHRHRRQRDRRRDRDGRFRASHADRHQPSERSADSRAVREQVRLAQQRERGLRQVAARVDAQRVRVDARGGRSRRPLCVARR
jgi:dipeptidyl-peptidase-3